MPDRFDRGYLYWPVSSTAQTPDTPVSGNPVIDYSGIKTTRNRKYNPEYISYIDKSLIAGGLSPEKRATILANIIEESGGDPFALDGTGKFYGLLQWSDDRYKKTGEKDIWKELDNQVRYILESEHNTTDHKSWTHGGPGTGYNSYKDAVAAYNSDALDDAMKGFTLGYVRPTGKMTSYNNRLKVAKQLYDLKGFRPFDAGGFIQKYGADKVAAVLYKDGGGIHIKPSHRGRLTELKKRTGKSEAELYNDGNPAHKKMVVFARNARKWKHGDGGLLRKFDAGGTVEDKYYGVLPASVVTASLPAKFHGSQEAARRYAEGYKFGKRVAQGRDEFANEWIAPAVMGLSAGPAGAIAGLSGRMVDVGVNALTEGDKNTWGDLLVSPQKHPWWNLAANFTNPGYLVAGPLSKGLQNDLTSLGREAVGLPAETVKATADVPVASELQKPQVIQALAPQASYEIADLGGGYMLKSLMRGNPLEKQISKQGTVSVNNIKALMNKGSKVEQAVVDKVLASEEFTGKKAVDYNKFRKAVQDELITYERTPDTRWEGYGMDRIGMSAKKNNAQDIEEAINSFIREHNLEYVGRGADGVPQYYDLQERRTVRYDELYRLAQTGELELGSLPKVETYKFSSPRIPLGSDRHYDANTLGHSRTYTTIDEPDVLHVMESQSDWAQADGVRKPYDSGFSQYLNNPDELKEFIAGHERLLREMEAHPKDYTPGAVSKQRENIKHHKSILKSLLEKQDSVEQEKYLVNNYTSRQIQENLRIAAEKGQTKMRYPTRETAAKIEGYPEQINYYDKNGFKVNEPYEYPENVAKRIESIQNEIDKIDLDDLDTFAPFEIVEGSFAWGSNSGEVTNAKLLAKLRDRILRDRDSLNQMQRYGDDTNTVAKRLDDREKLFDKQVAKYKEKYGHEPELDVYSSKSREAQARRAILQPELKELLGSGPMQLKKGLIEKKEYSYEDILRKYTEFPKQFKKLYKNAEVRTVTDPKGNTWYEVDVPKNYLQQEWAYENGGHLNRLALGGIIERYGKDKIKSALAKMKQSK